MGSLICLEIWLVICDSFLVTSVRKETWLLNNFMVPLQAICARSPSPSQFVEHCDHTNLAFS